MGLDSARWLAGLSQLSGLRRGTRAVRRLGLFSEARTPDSNSVQTLQGATTLKTAARWLAPALISGFLLGMGVLGCTGSEVQVADPAKENVPPPPPPMKPGDKGTQPPAGGGSPPGSPDQYTR